jgi:hypothetical protein
MNPKISIVILLLLPLCIIHAQTSFKWDESTQKKMGIDSSIQFYFSYIESYRVVTFKSGVQYGGRFTIDQSYNCKKYDYLSQMDEALVKVCSLDSTEIKPIIDILNKMDFFNLPVRLPENPRGNESTLSTNFVIGYRHKETKTFKLIDLSSGIEGTFPNNSRNLANRLRKLLIKLSKECTEPE